MYRNSFSESYDLYVIGHSLDVTDREIIKETFGRAKNIYIFFHADKARADYIRNLVNILGKEKFEEHRKKRNLTFISQENLCLDWDTLKNYLLD
jgi:hypothetical protein